MNSAQHLVLTLGLILGFSVQAQEIPDTSAAAEEIPAPQQSLLKSAATKDYNKPLYFDQLDNGLLLPPMELEYDLTLEKGQSLKVGPVLLNDKTFNFSLIPLGKTHPQISKALTSSQSGQMALVMTWPQALLKYGTLEMISRTGNVLWKYDISESAQNSWINQLQQWRTALVTNSVPASQVASSGIFGSSYAITDVKSSGAPFANTKDTFRFCITQQDGRNYSKICSQWYGIQRGEEAMNLARVRIDAVNPRVLFNNEEANLHQSPPVAADGPTSFFAELAKGETYEFIAAPNKLQLMDIADTANPKVMRIVGYDTRPLGKSLILNPEQYTKLTKMLGFEDTIGDPRRFWAAALKTDEPKVYLPGQGGGIFKQRFELSEIPRRQSRVYLNKHTPPGTYVDGVKLFGRKQPTAVVTSSQNSVEMDDSDPSLFMWRFKATERGEINRSYLNVEFEGKTYKSYFEIYKGYPRELSARLSMAKSSSDFIFMGEFAYNQWFEDLFSWTNYYVSRQRWGISLKYFRSFNELKVSTDGRTAPLDVLTADLKYRFTPGLWNRDETVGLLGSYQNVNFDKLKAPMLGGGIFWARSMPKVFDDVFNLVPLFKYPKWVDVEFIYYSSSLDSNVKLNSSMSLNFHGKVLWSQSLFGEAGFGIKRYAFTDTNLNQKADLNTFYGTVGVGLNF
ncbi:MAG: hypothetical protein J7501_08715 [Bdellovibrio sp.]|nr:hypothetical protein [Bdellovibrio sp.]